MKKLLLFLTVCVTLTSCASVGTQPDNSISSVSDSAVSEIPTNSEIPTSEEVKKNAIQLTNCFKKEDFALPDDMTISTAELLADGNIMLYLTSKEDFDSVFYYKTDKDFRAFELLKYEKPEEMQNYDNAFDYPFFNTDGTFCTIVTLEDHGGVIAPEEWDENFDYESYNENCNTTYMICTYSADGKILTKNEFEYPEEVYDDYGYPLSGHTIADGNSLLIPFEDGSIRRLSSDGTFTTLYTLENPEDYLYIDIPHLYRDRDGKIIVRRTDTTENPETSEVSHIVNFIEFDGEKMGDTVYSCEEYLNGSVVFGRGDYRFFVTTIDGIIGIKDDGTTENVLDWLSSSLNAMYTIFPCGENDFIGMDWNSNNEEQVLKLVPRDMSEFENVEFITVSNCDTRIINDFNNSSEKYRVQLVQYSYEDNQQLNMDIISGNAPDIVFGLDYSTYLNYCKKGVFTDLYELMDDELNKDMIMPNVITAMERDGKLYSLCTRFDINTLVAKTSVCDKENWTFSDMLSLYDNSTAEHLYDGETKLDMFRRMFYTMNDLIDYDNAKCNFNNTEFIQLLEFCNRFVDKVDAPEKWDETHEWEQYMTDKYHWLGNDKIVVSPMDFVSLSQYNLVKYTQGNGEDLTFVGYPSNNGKGGRITPEYLVSITENCENKQGAWEFLKFYIMNENNAGDGYSSFIPVIESAFTKAMNNEINKKHSASGVEYPSYTQEDIDMLTDYIMSCDTIGTVLDKDIVAVCEEEAGLYFAGEQTAETSAEHIQNRVSILISERS